MNKVILDKSILKLMIEERLWLPDDEFDKKITFLKEILSDIEDGFLIYSRYVPFREENKQISSIKFAEYILRIYPLLTIAFRTLLLARPMRKYYERITRKSEVDVKEFVSKWRKLRRIIKKDHDKIECFYSFFNEDFMREYWANETLSNEEVFVKNEIPYLELDEPLMPFREERFKEMDSIRDSIEHRETIEASLDVALNCLACLAILIYRIVEGSWDQEIQTRYFTSKLFDLSLEPINWGSPFLI